MMVADIRTRAEELGADVSFPGAALSLHAQDKGLTDAPCPIAILHQVVTMLERPGFRSEGHGTRKVALAGDRKDAGRLDAFLTEIARLQARERAIAGHGTEHSPYPAWAFSVDALAAAITRLDGIDLTSCARPIKWHRATIVYCGHRATVDDVWDWSRTRHAVSANTPEDAAPGTGRSLVCEMKDSRLVLRVYTPRGVPITLREEPAGTRLLLHDRLPDTMMTALGGRQVAEVVGGLGDTHEIVSAKTRAGMTELTVKGPRVPLAPAPEGIDTSWLA